MILTISIDYMNDSDFSNNSYIYPEREFPSIPAFLNHLNSLEDLDDIDVVTTSEEIFNWVRLAIKCGRINLKAFLCYEFVDGGIFQIDVDKDGRCEHYPSIWEYKMEILSELL